MIKLESLEAVHTHTHTHTHTNLLQNRFGGQSGERELHFKNQKCNMFGQSNTSNLIKEKINIEKKSMCFSEC